MGREKVLRAWFEGREGEDACVCTRVRVSVGLAGAGGSVTSSERDAKIWFLQDEDGQLWDSL